MTDQLPPGFTLDAGPGPDVTPGLPPGFTLDSAETPTGPQGGVEFQDEEFGQGPIPLETQRLPEPVAERVRAIPLEQGGLSPVQENVRQLQQREIQAVPAGELRGVQEENAQRRLNEIQEKLGGPFDPTGSLGGTLESPTEQKQLRADFQRSDKFKEIQDKFAASELGKTGDIRSLKLSTGENVVVFRENAEVPWKQVDSTEVELIGDTLDFLGTVGNEEFAAETVATLLSGGAGAVGRVVAPAVGSAIGTIAKALTENARGFERSGKFETATDATLNAFLTGLMSKLVSFKDQLIKKTPEVEDAISVAETAAREGIEPAVIGQTAQNPIIRNAYEQAAGTIQSEQDRAVRQREGLLRAIQRNADDATDNIDPQLAEINATKGKDARAAMGDLISGKSRLDSGEAITDIVTNFVDREKSSIGRAYDAALQLGQDATFDLAPAQKTAVDEIRGVVGRARSGEALPAGDNISGEFRDALDTLMNLDPNVRAFESGGQTDSALEVLKTLRSRFFMLSLPAAGARRNAMEDSARKIHKALTEVIDSPKGESSQEFKQALKDANKKNFDFERLTEAGFMRAMLRDKDRSADSASRLAASFTTGGKPNSINTLKKIASPEEFQNFKEGWISNIIADPSSIVRNLDSFAGKADQSSLRKIITPTEEAELRNYAKEAKRISGSQFTKQLETEDLAVDKAREILKGESRASLVDAVNRTGGMKGPLARNLKAATYEDILRSPGVKTRDLRTGKQVINPEAAIKKMDQLVSEKKIRAYMTPGEIKNFEDLIRFMAIVSGGTDIGGSFRKASMTSKMKGFLLNAPAAALGGAALFNDKMTARMLSSPAGQRLMEGGALKRVKPNTLKAIRLGTILLGTTARELESKNRKNKEQ